MMNPTGPFTADEFKALINAPHGEALKRIQQLDPLYGKNFEDGEKRKWRVKLIQEVRMAGYVTVEATCEEEAEALAEAIPDHTISWDAEDDDTPYVAEVKLK